MAPPREVFWSTDPHGKCLTRGRLVLTADPEITAVPGGGGTCSTGRGLMHPPRAAWSSSCGPTPHGRLILMVRTPGAHTGPPPQPTLAGRGHSPESPPPPRACPAWPSANSGPGLSRSGDQGRGPSPARANQRRPHIARGQSAPSHFGRSRRKHSTGIALPRPALPHPPPRGSVDRPAPPRPRRVVPPRGCEGGSCGRAPANRERGSRSAANGKLGPLDHVLPGECPPGVPWCKGGDWR